MNIHDASNILKIGTPLEQARQAVILIHGRGGNAWDIAGLSSTLQADQTTYLVPSATHGSWYPHRFLTPVENNEAHLSSALNVIHELIHQIQRAGIPGHKIALIGFSQGACLALEYAYRNPQRFLLVAGLSGALVGPLETIPPRTSPAPLQGTPVLLGCSESDRHIPLEYVKCSAEQLKKADAEVTLLIEAGSAHAVFQEEIDWIKGYLQGNSSEPKVISD